MRDPPASQFVLEGLQHWAILSENKNTCNEHDNGRNNYNSTLEICLICHAKDLDHDNYTDSVSSIEDSTSSPLFTASLCGGGCVAAVKQKKQQSNKTRSSHHV
jgi:hypothetical protein